MVKNAPANEGEMGSIPRLGRFHMPRGNYAYVPKLLRPVNPGLCNKRSHGNEKPIHHSRE